MKNFLRILFTVICLLSVTVTASAATVTADTAYSKTQAHLAALAEENTPTVGDVGGEWMVIGLARSGADTSSWKEAYYNNVLTYVSSNINDYERLNKNKSSDNSRIILALTSLGYDVTSVDGHNLLMGLTSMTYLKKQGVNGPIWALIAFDSHDYDIPDGGYGDDQVSRDTLVDYILEKQLEDGGWALTGTTADPDMTGMAVQSLAPYYNEKPAVKAALDKALTCMAGMIAADGSLSSWGTVNSESCAQVITALTAMGIDPVTDARFQKNGGNLIDNLLTFYVNDSGFAHVLTSTSGYTGGAYNQMATEQAFYALTSYQRLTSNQTTLYDMTDVVVSSGTTGDVNGDDQVNSVDAAMAYAAHNGKMTLTTEQFACADVNSDDVVNSVDAAMIYAYHNGKLLAF